MMVELVHLSEGSVPVLAAGVVSENLGSLRGMFAGDVVEEGPHKVLGSGWRLLFVRAEFNRDLIP